MAKITLYLIVASTAALATAGALQKRVVKLFSLKQLLRTMRYGKTSGDASEATYRTLAMSWAVGCVVGAEAHRQRLQKKSTSE